VEHDNDRCGRNRSLGDVHGGIELDVMGCNPTGDEGEGRVLPHRRTGATGRKLREISSLSTVKGSCEGALSRRRKLRNTNKWRMELEKPWECDRT
jgi:hypothetical protein